MECLPAWPAVAVVVGAHIQRVSLELYGLETYLQVLLPRLESHHDYSHAILPVVGIFVRDATAVQQCVRMGLLTWFLQPLTRHLKVWSVVEAQAPPYLSSVEISLPMHHHPNEMARVMNLTGSWLSSMVFALSRQLCASTLPPLTPIAHSRDSKRARTELVPSSRGRDHGSLAIIGAGQQPRTKPQQSDHDRSHCAGGVTAGGMTSAEPNLGSQPLSSTSAVLPPELGHPSRDYHPPTFSSLPIA